MKRKAIKTMLFSALALGTINSGVAFAEEGNIVPKTDNTNIQAASYQKGQVVNASVSLNIRKSASTSSTVVGKIPANGTFDIIAKSGTWYKIKYGTIEGYVSGDYVKVLSTPTSGTGNNSSSAQTQITGKGQVVNASVSLNIRKSASTSSTVVGKIPANGTFDIIAKSGTWYKIKYGTIEGYVSGDYVKVLSTSTPSGDSSNNSGSNSGGSSSNGSESGNTGSGNTQTQITGKGQVVNASVSLNIRKSASTSSTVVGKIPANGTFDIIAKSGTWYKIKYGTIEGYVSGDYVKVLSSSTSGDNSGNSGSNGGNVSGDNNAGDVTGGNDNNSGNNSDVEFIGKGQVVNASVSLNIRQSASTSSTVVGKIPANGTFDIIAKSGTWYKIKYGTIVGYVSGDYVKVLDSSSSEGGSNSSDDLKDVDVDKFNAVLEVLSTQIGSPYVYGGAGEIITETLINDLKKLYPNQSYSVPEEFYDSTWRAFDCSGFMQWGFKNIGVNLGRNTSAQIKNGLEVDLKDIQPGDLLFYSTLTHVGMYIGDDKWIESPRTGLNVRITTVPWNLIGRARRVI